MKRFRKLICVTVVAMMIFSFMACAQDTTPDAPAPDTDATEDAPDPDAGEDAGEVDAGEVDAGEDAAEDDFVTDIDELYGTFIMWNWDYPNNTNINAVFNEVHPNVIVEMFILGPPEVLERYQMAIAAGTEVGDIVWAERSTHAAMLRVGGFERLCQPPYNVDRNIWLDSVIPFVVDEDDYVIGFDISVCPAGFGYNLNLAEQFLGTSDRYELEAMFPTWESMLAVAGQVYEESGGRFHMFANIDSLVAPLVGQWTEYAVVDGQLNFENTVYPVLYKVVQARDSNAMGLLGSWTPEFFASMNEENFIFLYLAAWSVEVIFQSNAPDMHGTMGFMRTPEGDTSWGGTTMMIPSAAENKELAFAYLNFLYGTREGAEIIKDVSVQLVGLREAFDDPDFIYQTTPWFPGINIGHILYGEIAPNMISLFPNLDHQQILGYGFWPVIGEIINEGITYEQARTRVHELIAEQRFAFLD